MLIALNTYASDDCGPKGAACRQEIENLATSLKQDRLDLASGRFEAVKSCVEALEGLEERHKAARTLISVVFSDVGGPPVPKRLRTLLSEVIALVRKVKVTKLSDLLPDRALDELDLFRIDFRNTDLRGFSFRGSFLIETDFAGAILDGTDFSKAYIRNVNFKNASLRNTVFHGADWFNALGLNTDQLRQADLSSLLTCPKDTEGFHSVLAARYHYPFKSWEKRIQDELDETWQAYRVPGGLCDKRDSWIR